ncbi:unnamed protein product [Schistosoma curassoni]|uniref:Uncharacterized protein n=1 Tax=Schistosoma curassoni TaxID=6186 RepID=A0A183KUT9_9TREM|nr:unnamed protein product [Schistosoma curassoni]
MEYLFNPITMLTHFSLFPFSAVMSNSNTLQSVDGDLLNNNVEGSKTLEKKIKKKGSFRMPSFSRKKKH